MWWPRPRSPSRSRWTPGAPPAGCTGTRAPPVHAGRARGAPHLPCHARQAGRVQQVERESACAHARGAPRPAPAWGAALTRAARARSKMWERELMDEEMDALLRAFEGTARVSCQHGMSIVSLICNVARTSEILEQARAPRRWPPAAAAPPPRSCRSRALHLRIRLHERAALEASSAGSARRAGAPAPWPCAARPRACRGRAGVSRAGPRRREREDDEPGRVEDQHLPHRQRRRGPARRARAAPPVFCAGQLTLPGLQGAQPMHAPALLGRCAA